MNESGAGVTAPPAIALAPLHPPSPACSPHSPSLLLPPHAFDGLPITIAPKAPTTSVAEALVTAAVGTTTTTLHVTSASSVKSAHEGDSLLCLHDDARGSGTGFLSPSPAPSPSSPRAACFSESPHAHVCSLHPAMITSSTSPSLSHINPCTVAHGQQQQQQLLLLDSTRSSPFSSQNPCSSSSSPTSSSSSHTQAHSCPLSAASLLDYHDYQDYHHHHHHHHLNHKSPGPASPRSSSTSSSPSASSPSPSDSDSPLTPPPTPPTEAGGAHGAGVTSPCQMTFREAVSNGDTTELRRILEEREGKVNVNLLDPEGQTALHHGCLQGNLELVKILVRFGADVRLANRDGWAPLHLAVFAGHADVMHFLLTPPQSQGRGAGAGFERRT